MLRLKEILKEKGLTQLFIAKAMNLTAVTINQWATGKSMPSLESLLKLCDILDISLNDLVIQKKTKKNIKI